MTLSKINLPTHAVQGSISVNLIQSQAITGDKLDFRSGGLNIPELMKLGGSDEILCPVCAEWGPHGMSCGGVVVCCAPCVQDLFIDMAQSMIKDRFNKDLIPLRLAVPDRKPRTAATIAKDGIGTITVANAWDCWAEQPAGTELVTTKGLMALPRKGGVHHGQLPICEHCENQFACIANNGAKLALKASGLSDEMKGALWP